MKTNKNETTVESAIDTVLYKVEMVLIFIIFMRFPENGKQ